MTRPNGSSIPVPSRIGGTRRSTMLTAAVSGRTCRPTLATASSMGLCQYLHGNAPRPLPGSVRKPGSSRCGLGRVDGAVPLLIWTAPCRIALPQPAGEAAFYGRLPCLRVGLAEWLEAMLGDIPADLSAEARALEVGVAEMEPDEDACLIDVFDHVVKPVVTPYGPRHSAVKDKGDLVGAKERIQGCDHGSAVAGVRRRILGEVRRRSERLPAGVRHRLRVAVGVCERDRLVRPPEPVVVLGVEAGNHCVAAGDVCDRQHPSGLYEVEPPGGGEAEHAVVPLPQVVVGPESRLERLLGRSAPAVDPAQVFHLVEVVGVFLAGQGVGAIEAKLRCSSERKRLYPWQP